MIILRSKRSFFLLLLDLVSLYLSFTLASFICLDSFFSIFELYQTHIGWVFAVFLFCLYLFNFYSPFRKFSSEQTAVSLLMSLSSGVVVAIFLSFFVKNNFPKSAFFFGTLFFFFFVFYTRYYYNKVYGSTIMRSKIVVIGNGSWAAEIVKLIKNTPFTGLDIVGLISHQSWFGHDEEETVPVLGDILQLDNIIKQYQIKKVVIALDENSQSLERNIIAELYKRNIQIISSHQLYEDITGKVAYNYFRGEYLISMAIEASQNKYLIIKRGLDIILSIILAVITLPLLMASILILAIDYRSIRTTFIIQKRIGKHGVPFDLYKLRTMLNLPNGEKQITFVGKWLRRYRIDELPQLFNIVIGDMSLIGSRPELPYFINYSRKNIPYYNVVLSISPGLTGWAQVKFRHTSQLEDYNEKFCFDLYYLKHCSLQLDILILFKTVRTILFGRGS